MLLTVNIEHKTIGGKELFTSLSFSVEAREKIAIIGRNGVGKTTLFRLLTNEDNDFEGSIQWRNSTRVVSTAQEHHDVAELSALNYIIENLPDYKNLKHIIDTYPEIMGDNLRKIEIYSNALEHFSSLGYYNIEDTLLQSLADYQINEEMARAPLGRLSGGQKRFVELVRVEHSDADLALIDEPTNHMDYVAKNTFIGWLKAVKHSVVVISHDRDVLEYVDRIIEIKDGKAFSFKGNYTAYLKQNAVSTTTKMHDFEVVGRQIINLKAKIVQFRRLKEKARDPDTIKQFKHRENQATAELAKLEIIEKPSFWIDRESAGTLKKAASEHYEKYKAKNVIIRTQKTIERERELLNIEEIQLSYGEQPLFKPISFTLRHGDRLQLVGRNGVGKTTLVKAIIDAAYNRRSATYRGGTIFTDRQLRLSVYEQEVGGAMLEMPLKDAIEHIYLEQKLPINNEKAMQLMGDYLFDPYQDGELKVSMLSGGQKARLQIIKMLSNNPNLLILDEPTNHLDLPSIEELETALTQYHGALLYVSHDSYFTKNIGGERVTLEPSLT
ncbi:MAG TPA: ATP-binding cassette domain-containing protein [Candidatus Saccharimonadales bacterium]